MQNIFNTNNQLIVKYDWYDPNIKVKETDLGKPGTNLTPADIKYSTLGLGYAHNFNSQTKIIFYYDFVKMNQQISAVLQQIRKITSSLADYNSSSDFR